MGSTIILTDSSVQFILPSFPGRSLVKVVNLGIRHQGLAEESGKAIKPADLPMFLTNEDQVKLILPSVEQLQAFFTQDENGQVYDQVLGIFASSGMCAMVARALETQKLITGRTSLLVIDSLTTSVGLGMVVQIAAETLSRGSPLADTERLIRSLLPHIYGVICTPSLSYLHNSGFLDRAQANVGEMLGLFPIFAVEEGRLTPLEKVRNHRQVLDFFQEFMDEFDQLQYIAFVQSAVGANSQDGRLLREHAQDHFTRTAFSEHTINLPVATLFGPSAMGLFVVEPSYRKAV